FRFRFLERLGFLTFHIMITWQRDQFLKRMKMPYEPKSVFRLYTDSNIDNTCTVELFKPHTLDACGFNSSSSKKQTKKNSDGMMENWISRLASALKSSEGSINLVIADWLTLAHQHYPIAVQYTRIVGQDIAHLLRWLEVRVIPLGKVHWIGYSLGAHISGFAGSNLAVSEKTFGRITGLDPAGPLFEGMSHTERLSPEDARFVDAIHTFTQEHMGLSVGIKQPVAHFAFYPNGGSFQPGCQLHVQNIYAHFAQYGIMGELLGFINEWINSRKRKEQIMAYKCSDNTAFDKGYCLDCRKNCSNTLGYDIKKVCTGTSKRLFLKTRSHMPYKLFHYQIRIQFINQTDKIEPTFTVSLTGTLEEISGNKTFIFTWEGSPMWANIGPQLTVGKITVKAEAHNSLCSCQNYGLPTDMYIEPSQEKVFVRCEKKSKKQQQRWRMMKHS
uniref:Lipase, hepatic a n=1 Tax=Cyprinus carpio carpio TaxID=630221 RepID=A0A8C1A423_CYPCA